VSTSIGGLVAVYTRLIVQDFDPVSLGLLRYGIALLCLFAGMMWIQRPALSRSDRVPMALIGMLFFSVFPVGFSVALKYTTAAQGALVFSLMPVITIILAGVAKKEIITNKKICGSLLVFLGVASVVDIDFDADKETVLGNMIMFLMACLGAGFNLLARPYLKRYNKLYATTWFMFWGWLAMFVALVCSGQLEFSVPPRDIWVTIFILGSIGGALPIFLFNWALGHIESTRVSLSIGFNPLVAAIAGAVVLSEPFTVFNFLGLMLVVVGISIANWRPLVDTN